MSRKVILSAMTMSGNPTLGNYLGAIKNWVKLQDSNECFYMVADLHAITTRQDPKELCGRTRTAIAQYIACGLSADKSALFVQSHVPQHAELGWVMTCFSTMGELSRMTQFKDKSAKQGESIPTGLFCYPLLMAADILLYQADLVPVGEDQKQHVELTRDLAIRMNNLFGKDLFKIPAFAPPAVGAKIMSLQNPLAKMSKSDTDASATVFLDDSDDAIVKKVKRAVTDSGSEITPEIINGDSKPGLKNLLTIQSALTGKPIAEIVTSYAGKQYGHLKVETADIVVNAIKPIREETTRLLKDPASLDAILKRGAVAARERAQKTVSKVYERVGFIPAN